MFVFNPFIVLLCFGAFHFRYTSVYTSVFSGSLSMYLFTWCFPWLCSCFVVPENWCHRHCSDTL